MAAERHVFCDGKNRRIEGKMSKNSEFSSGYLMLYVVVATQMRKELR